jgi:hypothetical protein
MEKLSRQRKSRSERHCPIIFFPSISLFLAYFFDSWRLGKKRLADCIANSEPKIAKRNDYTRKINDLTLVFLHLRLRSCRG